MATTARSNQREKVYLYLDGVILTPFAAACVLALRPPALALVRLVAVQWATFPALRLLSSLALPLLPPLLGFRLMRWSMFHGRIDGRAAMYR